MILLSEDPHYFTLADAKSVFVWKSRGLILVRWFPVFKSAGENLLKAIHVWVRKIAIS